MEHIKEIKAAISSLQESQSRIEKALIGDDKYKQKGIIHLVQEHQVHIESDKKFKNKIAGGIAVFVSTLTILWNLLVEWWKNKHI